MMPICWRSWMEENSTYYDAKSIPNYGSLINNYKKPLGNQVIYEKNIITESDNKYYLKDYTTEMREQDQVNFMTELDTVSQKSHAAFVEWLNTIQTKS